MPHARVSAPQLICDTSSSPCAQALASIASCAPGDSTIDALNGITALCPSEGGSACAWSDASQLALFATCGAEGINLADTTGGWAADPGICYTTCWSSLVSEANSCGPGTTVGDSLLPIVGAGGPCGPCGQSSAGWSAVTSACWQVDWAAAISEDDWAPSNADTVALCAPGSACNSAIVALAGYQCPFDTVVGGASAGFNNPGFTAGCAALVGGGAPVTITTVVIAEGEVSDYSSARLDAMKENIVASFEGNGPEVEDIEISVESASVRLTISIQAPNAQAVQDANTAPFLTAMATPAGAAALLSTPSFPVSVREVEQPPELPASLTSTSGPPPPPPSPPERDDDDDNFDRLFIIVAACVGAGVVLVLCVMTVVYCSRSAVTTKDITITDVTTTSTSSSATSSQA